jgi:hypothetical protein
VAAPYFALPQVAGAEIVVLLAPLSPSPSAVDGSSRATTPLRVARQPSGSGLGPAQATTGADRRDDDYPGAALDWGSGESVWISPDELPADPDADAAADDLSAGDDRLAPEPDDGLAGLIAMFDAEVRRGAMLRGETPDQAARPAGAEEVTTHPSVLRPTLATSRRRGIRIERAADDAVTGPDSDESPAQPSDTAPVSTSPLGDIVGDGVPATASATTAEVDDPAVSALSAGSAPAKQPRPMPAHDDGEPVGRAVGLATSDDTSDTRGRSTTPTDNSTKAAALHLSAPQSPAAERPAETALAVDGAAIDQPPVPPIVAAAGEPPLPVEPAATTPADDSPIIRPNAAPAEPGSISADASTSAETAETALADPSDGLSGAVVFGGPPSGAAVTQIEPVGLVVAASARADGDGSAVLALPADESQAETRPSPPERKPAIASRQGVGDDRRTAASPASPSSPASPAVPSPPRVADPASSSSSSTPSPSMPSTEAGWFAAPAATIASFEQLTGVDLGFVPIVREPTVDREADRLNARAFTRDGVVHLPAAAGAVDGPHARALLAHEMTHVLQQRALGTVADESGPLGEAMEAQADAVERAARGESVDDAERAWPEQLAGPMPAGLTWTSEAGFRGDSAGSPSWGVPPSGPSGVAQRAPRGAEALPALVVDGGGTAGDDDGVVPLVYPEPESPTRPDPASPTTATNPVAAYELSDADVARVTERVLTDLALPELDPRDPDLLDVLAAGLYGRLRTSLRSELIADRERAGLLTEFH